MDWFGKLSRPAQCGVVLGAVGVCTTSVFAYKYFTYTNEARNDIKPPEKTGCKMDSGIQVSPCRQRQMLSEAPIKHTEVNLRESVSVDDGFSEQKTTRKVILLGLQHAGKSSLLAQLSKDGSNRVRYQATKGFNVVCISFDNIDLSIWEIGGTEEYRSYWKNFIDSTNVIIFVVDSTNRDDLPLVKDFFFDIIEELVDDIEFRIVATKCDDEDSTSTDELHHALGIGGMDWNILRVAVQAGGAPENMGVDVLQQYCLQDVP